MGKPKRNDDEQDPQKSVLLKLDWPLVLEEATKMPSKTPRARVHPTKSCHDLASYYGFKDLQKTSLNYLLRELAITLKAKYDLKSIIMLKMGTSQSTPF